MKNTRALNILIIASASGAVHGLAAILFVPALSFLLLAIGAPPAPFKAMVSASDNGMAFAVAVPVLYAAAGFIFGGLAAIAHALATAPKRPVKAVAPEQNVPEPSGPVQPALGNVA